MIVIASNNGEKVLPNFIESMERFGTGGHSVLIVDTHSTRPEAIAYLQRLQGYKGPLDLKVVQPPYKNGYDAGAYLFAFREFKSPSYLFLHDGMEAKSEEWVSQFEKNCTKDTPCVPWIAFSPLLMGCHQGHVDFMVQGYGQEDWPASGFFGSMFYATREALEYVDISGLFPDNVIPTNKTGSEGMERGFAIAFHRARIETNPVHPHIHIGMIESDGYPHLRKIFHGRK